MSGWIKLEKDRRDDPRVIRMARELRNAGVTHERFTSAMHVTLVLGCLDVLWCYADTHVRDDDTLDLGPDEINELVGLSGFCKLMPADWLEVIDANRVKLPDFHAHNGTESKKKALNQKRQERKRNADALQAVTQTSRTSVTGALPDLDQTKTYTKTREEGEGARAARATRLPEDFSLTPERRLVAEAERLPAERVFAKFCDYWRAAAGAKARKHDWEATWRNWCRGEADRSGGSNGTSKQVAKPRVSALERVRLANSAALDDDPGGSSGGQSLAGYG